MSLIIGNIIILAIEYDDMTKELEIVLHNFDSVFSVAFIIECLLKIYAIGFNTYYKSSWNRYKLINKI